MKEDKILDNIIKIREDVSAIKEHLKALNGRVIANQTSIERNRCDIDKVQRMQYYYAGGLAVLVITIEIILKLL